MSRSIHVTKRNFARLSRKEIDEEKNDPHSDLSQWARKGGIKKTARVFRTYKKLLNLH